MTEFLKRGAPGMSVSVPSQILTYSSSAMAELSTGAVLYQTSQYGSSVVSYQHYSQLMQRRLLLCAVCKRHACSARYASSGRLPLHPNSATVTEHRTQGCSGVCRGRSSHGIWLLQRKLQLQQAQQQQPAATAL